MSGVALRPRRSGWNVEYEHGLRAIGAVLDEEGTRYARLIETSDGFLVQSRQRHGPEPKLLHFSYRQLEACNQELAERRGQDEARAVLSRRRESYQDFFRALGWELDRQHAQQLLIEELDEGIAVTYLCPEPSAGTVLEKRLIVVEPGEQGILREDALARRGIRYLMS